MSYTSISASNPLVKGIDKAKVAKIIDVCNVSFDEACRVLKACHMDLYMAINRFLSGTVSTAWFQVGKTKKRQGERRSSWKGRAVPGTRVVRTENVVPAIRRSTAAASAAATTGKGPFHAKRQVLSAIQVSSGTTTPACTPRTAPPANHGSAEPKPAPRANNVDMRKRRDRGGRKNHSRTDMKHDVGSKAAKENQLNTVETRLPAVTVSSKRAFNYAAAAAAGTCHAKQPTLPPVQIKNATGSPVIAPSTAPVFDRGNTKTEHTARTGNSEEKKKRNRGGRKHRARKDVPRVKQGAKPTATQPSVEASQDSTVVAANVSVTSGHGPPGTDSTAAGPEAAELPSAPRTECANACSTSAEGQEEKEKKQAEAIAASVVNSPATPPCGGVNKSPVLKFGSFELIEFELANLPVADKCSSDTNTATAVGPAVASVPDVPESGTLTSSQKPSQVSSRADGFSRRVARSATMPSQMPNSTAPVVPGAVWDGAVCGPFMAPPQTYPPYYMGMMAYGTFEDGSRFSAKDTVGGGMGHWVLPGAMYQPPAQYPYPIYGFTPYAQPGMHTGMGPPGPGHFGYAAAGPNTPQGGFGGCVGFGFQDNSTDAMQNIYGGGFPFMSEHHRADASSVPSGHNGVAGGSRTSVSAPEGTGIPYKGCWTNRHPGNGHSNVWLGNQAPRNNAQAGVMGNGGVYTPVSGAPGRYWANSPDY